jgi:hypothetical protein
MKASQVDNGKAYDESDDAVGMCSGSGSLAADVDEGPARETRLTAAVAVPVESSRVVLMA